MVQASYLTHKASAKVLPAPLSDIWLAILLCWYGVDDVFVLSQVSQMYSYKTLELGVWGKGQLSKHSWQALYSAKDNI